MGFVALSYYFMNIYMWSVILSTLIYFSAMFVLANTMMERKGIDGMIKSTENSGGGFADKLAQNPFILFVIPIVNILVIFLMIGMVAMIRLHQWGKIKIDILNPLPKDKDEKN